MSHNMVLDCSYVIFAVQRYYFIAWVVFLVDNTMLLALAGDNPYVLSYTCKEKVNLSWIVFPPEGFILNESATILFLLSWSILRYFFHFLRDCSLINSMDTGSLLHTSQHYSISDQRLHDNKSSMQGPSVLRAVGYGTFLAQAWHYWKMITHQCI